MNGDAPELRLGDAMNFLVREKTEKQNRVIRLAAKIEGIFTANWMSADVGVLKIK